MQLLEDLSQRGILNRLDKRKLQQELDIHKLFLLTTYHAQSEGLLSEAYREIPACARVHSSVPNHVGSAGFGNMTFVLLPSCAQSPT